MLIKTKNLKEDIDTKVIDIVSLGEKIIVAKKDVALAKRLDRKAHAVWLKGENSISKADAIWHNAARTIKDEDYWCDKYSIDSWSGVELFDKFATEAGLEFDLAEEESLKEEPYRRMVSRGKSLVDNELFVDFDDCLIESSQAWDSKVAEADKLLDKIINQSNNEGYDDSDGYWSGEDEWCNRYMYYSNSVNDVKQVENLCAKYSTDTCKFYVFEDDAEEDPVSEIGYTLN